MRTLSVVLALSLAAACGAAPADPRVNREIARLEQALKAAESADLPAEMHDLFAVHRTALERAKRATSPEYRLYRLREPFTGIETLAFVAAHKGARQSVDDFRKLWDAQKPRFDAKAPQTHGTALERALMENATSRAERLFHASLPYSKASAPWSGLYYLGEAEGNLRFREFIRSIAGDSKEPAPNRASLTAMLGDLDRLTLTFFGGDVTNQNLISVSARLKEARELLNAGRIDGATLLAVEARAALSRRGGPKGTYPPHAAERSGSIARLLQSWAADEEAPMSEALRSEVVPFYGALYLAPPAHDEKRAAQVTVTLVRWPYT